jgi:hypothetical protein
VRRAVAKPATARRLALASREPREGSVALTRGSFASPRAAQRRPYGASGLEHGKDTDLPHRSDLWEIAPLFANKVRAVCAWTGHERVLAFRYTSNDRVLAPTRVSL